LVVSTTLPKSRILYVEDDLEIADMMSDVLTEHGFSATFVASAEAMDAALRREIADLVILDLMLPGEDGLSICRRLRASSSVPIIMVTARGEEIDRILGLEMGADDYICKPFSSRELIARIRALIRRTESGTSCGMSRSKRLAFAGWQLDASCRELFDSDGVRIALTGVEFDLLHAFCRNAGRTMSREHLIELVHNGMSGPIERSIDVHISRIRQKLEIDPPNPVIIKTIRLGGYVFTPSVVEL
jgi:two-component system OmpR family response regulator